MASSTSDAREEAPPPAARPSPRGTAGRTGARQLCDLGAAVPGQHAGIGLHAGIEAPDGVRPGAFLRSENVRGARRSAEDVVDIARHLDPDAVDARVDSRSIDRRNPDEVGAAAAQLLALSIQEFHAECPRDPHPAVVRRAATDADENPLGRVIEGYANQLTGAEGRGELRIALLV